MFQTEKEKKNISISWSLFLSLQYEEKKNCAVKEPDESLPSFHVFETTGLGCSTRSMWLWPHQALPLSCLSKESRAGSRQRQPQPSVTSGKSLVTSWEVTSGSVLVTVTRARCCPVHGSKTKTKQRKHLQGKATVWEPQQSCREAPQQLWPDKSWEPRADLNRAPGPLGTVWGSHRWRAAKAISAHRALNQETAVIYFFFAWGRNRN